MKHGIRAVMIAALGAAACGGAPEQPVTPPPRPVATVAAPPVATVAPAPVAAPEVKGIEAKTNDAEIVALAKKALACKWDRGEPDDDCAAVKEWRDSKLLEEGAGDATLVSFLEDPSNKVRYLGVRGLDRSGRNYMTTKELAERVVAVAEKETDEFGELERLGEVVGNIKLRPTKVWPRIKAVVTKSQYPALRKGIASEILKHNEDEDDVYATIKSLVKDPDKDTQRAAIASFYMGSNEKHYEETCALWIENASNPDEDVASEAASNIAGWHGGICQPHFDKFLDLVEQLAKSGGVKSSRLSLGDMMEKGNKATEAQQKRAMKVLKLIAENPKNDWYARSSALRTVIEYDKAGGRAFVGKFTNDSEKLVASRAKDLLAPKKK